MRLVWRGRVVKDEELIAQIVAHVSDLRHCHAEVSKPYRTPMILISFTLSQGVILDILEPDLSYGRHRCLTFRPHHLQ